MKPPFAMLTYSLFFCNTNSLVSIKRACKPPPTPTVPLQVSHLQKVGQHHVHVHVLLLSAAAHEAQVLSAGNGARLQGLLLSLQEGLDRQGELRRVPEHLCRNTSIEQSRAVWKQEAPGGVPLGRGSTNSPGLSPDGRQWTDDRRCTAQQAGSPPQRSAPHPEERR